MAAKKKDTAKTPTTAKKTTLDDDVTKPSTTAPGDGPADTTDPDESAQSAPPQPGDEAREVGTVNAVKSGPKRNSGGGSRRGKDRTEEYTAIAPDGTEVTVKRNIETGESKVS